jgi:catechol 2,3-dioxygenase-like lactoylglutathione lyase family enzyme
MRALPRRLKEVVGCALRQNQSREAHAMARIRHIALAVQDIDKTADFYEQAFGLKRGEKSEGKTAWRIYMSDGEVNLALLQYKSEVGSGIDPSKFVGIHHFGFQCDDLPKQQKRIEAAGGKFFFDLGDPDDDDFERKFKDPNGIIFDINWKGWTMTSSKVKAKKAGKPAARAAAARAKPIKRARRKPGKSARRR